MKNFEAFMIELDNNKNAAIESTFLAASVLLLASALF